MFVCVLISFPVLYVVCVCVCVCVYVCACVCDYVLVNYRVDSVLGNLVSICQSISSFPVLSAWEHTFVPREYLVTHLEDLFMK